jgi:hypothetical protein
MTGTNDVEHGRGTWKLHKPYDRREREREKGGGGERNEFKGRNLLVVGMAHDRFLSDGGGATRTGKHAYSVRFCCLCLTGRRFLPPYRTV